MRLDSNSVNSIRQRVDADLAGLERKWGTEAACREILRVVSKRKPDADETDILENLFQIVWLFNHCQQPGLISKKTADDLTKMVEYSLRLVGIKPYVSNLSYLYGIFYQARGKQLGASESPWLAAWNLNLAEAMVGNCDDDQAEPETFQAQLSLAEYQSQMGFFGESIEAYRRAEELAGGEDEVALARLGMIRCLRILNEGETALALVSGLTHFALAPQLRQMLDWEEIFLKSQQDDDVSALVARIKSLSESETEVQTPPVRHYLILAVLWCYASKRRAVIGELPRCAWLKRSNTSSDHDQRSSDMLRLLQTLETCYAKRGTIFEKLKALGDFLAQLRKADASEELVIFFAGVTRWLIRVKQKNSAVMVVNEYQRCSHQLSQGRTSALFGLLEDLGDKLNASGETTRAQGESRTLKSGMERTFLFIEMFAKLFLTAVAAKTGSLIASKSPKEIQQELIVKLSRYFVQYAAGAMKGPIHKFAQIILNIFSLPEEAEANFKSVLWARQVLPEKAMRKVFEDDMGKKIEEVFAEFDFDPIGVGSVSQVYRARLKDGAEVAVKIQYPDLDKITKQDMAMFQRIFTAARWLFPSLDVVAIKNRVQDLVDREIDFRDEVQVGLRYKEIEVRGARWSTPKIYTEMCTRRVMTTEYIRGMNLYQFSAVASAEERLAAAMAVAEFTQRSILEVGLVCIDPHPANIILSEGKVYIIDFGFFMKVSPLFVRLYRGLLLSYADNRAQIAERYEASLREANILRSSPEIQESDIAEFVTVLVKQFNWGSCADPVVEERFNDFYFKKGINKVFGSPDPEFFITYLGQRQAYKTISRFNVLQPDEWSVTSARELRAREAGQSPKAVPGEETDPAPVLAPRGAA